MRDSGALDGAGVDAQARSPGVGACGIIGGQTPAQLTPEQQIKALQVQLKQAQEKAQLFEAVIEVLRKDHGVRIVKKPLGKSSKKRSSKG